MQKAVTPLHFRLSAFPGATTPRRRFRGFCATRGPLRKVFADRRFSQSFQRDGPEPAAGEDDRWASFFLIVNCFSGRSGAEVSIKSGLLSESTGGRLRSRFAGMETGGAGKVMAVVSDIVDEAGQIGGEQMLQLLSCVKKNRGRVILSGLNRNQDHCEGHYRFLRLSINSNPLGKPLGPVRRFAIDNWPRLKTQRPSRPDYGITVRRRGGGTSRRCRWVRPVPRVGRCR